MSEHDHDVCPKCGADCCGGFIRVAAGGLITEQEIATVYGEKRCFSTTAVGKTGPGTGVKRYPCCGHEVPW